MSSCSFSQNLRFIRMLRHYTQQEMSDLLHICRQTYNHYETGRRAPDLETVLNISLILNISLDYLLGGNPVFLNVTYSEIQEFLETFSLLPPDMQQSILEITVHCKQENDS